MPFLIRIQQVNNAALAECHILFLIKAGYVFQGEVTGIEQLHALFQFIQADLLIAPVIFNHVLRVLNFRIGRIFLIAGHALFGSAGVKIRQRYIHRQFNAVIFPAVTVGIFCIKPLLI